MSEDGKSVTRRLSASHSRFQLRVPSTGVDWRPRALLANKDLGSPEIATAAVLIVLSCILLLATSSGLWFFSDFWPIASRKVTSFKGLTEPHGGHWLLFPTLLTKATLWISGESFYPGYFVSRVILYGLLSFLWFVIIRGRGGNVFVAYSVALLFALMGTSGWMVTVVYTGPIIVGICALLAAMIIDRSCSERSNVSPFLLASIVTIAVASSADGPALLGACIVVTLLWKRWRLLLSLLFPSVIYSMWFLLIARNNPNKLTPGLPSFSYVLRSPPKIAGLIGDGLASLVSLEGALWSFLFFVLFVFAIVFAIYRTCLRIFDTVIIATGLNIAILSVIVRGAQGEDLAAPNRLYLLCAYLGIGLIAVFASRPLQRSGRWLAPIVGVFLVLIGINLTTLRGEIDAREKWTSVDRAQVETALYLINEGRTFIPFGRQTPQGTNRSLKSLTVQGWKGRLHPSIQSEIEASLKLAIVGTQEPPAGAPLRLDGTTEPNVPLNQGCIELPGGTPLPAVVTKNGAITYESEPGDAVVVTWDGVSDFTATLGLEDGGTRMFYAAPESGTAKLSLSGNWPEDSARSVCGFDR